MWHKCYSLFLHVPEHECRGAPAGRTIQFCRHQSPTSADYWQQAWSVSIATITLIIKSHNRHATHIEMEAGGVWVGPFRAARATRSHAPARAAPVVPPYTALAGTVTRTPG